MLVASIVGPAAVAGADRFAVAEGLPPEAVKAIAPDPSGRLWVGTRVGLRTLVGGQFVVEASMLATDIASPVYRGDVADIAVGSDGEVLVATSGTLHRRAPDGTWQDQVGVEVGLENGIGAVMVEPNGDIWAGGRNSGLARRTAGSWAIVDEEFRAVGLAMDGNGAMWAAGTRRGAPVLVRNPKTPGETVFPLDADGILAGGAQALEATADGAWIGTSSGLAFVPTRGAPTPYDAAQLPSPDVLSIAPDGRNAAWIGTGSGLARVADGQVVEVIGLPADVQGREIRSLALDRSGNLWAGTPTGLVEVPIRSWVGDAELRNRPVTVVGHTTDGVGYAISDGQLFVARTGGGWAVPDLGGRTAVSAAPHSSGGVLLGTSAGWGVVRDGAFTIDERCCETRTVLAILEDEAGLIWAGFDEGVAAVDATDEAGFWSGETLGKNTVVDIFSGTRGQVWVAGANAGVREFNGLVAGRQITRNGTGGALSSEAVQVGLVTTTGETWLGTDAGLNRGVGDTWAPQGDLLVGRITALVEDIVPGRVWVGTEASGLVLVDCSIERGSGCAQSGFGEADGLGAPDVLSLARQGDQLWIGTSRGLVRHQLDVDPPTLQLGFVVDGSGSAAGTRVFQPGWLVADGVPCEASCPDELSWQTDTVDIGLAASDLEDPKDIRFLIDRDGSSPELSRDGSVQVHVQPGTKYTVTITAIDRHFNRSAPIPETFVIAPEPWWLSPPALVLWALLLVGAGLWYRTRGSVAYRPALVTVRSSGEDVVAEVETGGAKPVSRRLGPEVTRLGPIHERLKTTANLDPAEIAVGAALLQSLSGDGEPTGARARERVRMGLDLAGAAALDRLPWEILHPNGMRGGGSDDRLVLVRRVHPAEPAGGQSVVAADQPTTVPSPAVDPSAGRRRALDRGARLLTNRLRILVAFASPEDRARIEHDERREILAVAARHRRLVVTLVEHMERDKLRNELDHGYDVLHFIGHGEIREKQPVILFEDEDRMAHMAGLRHLVRILDRAAGRVRRPRLVVLSACNSADYVEGQPASGLAAGLVAAGVVPAAIGMAYPFNMRSAAVFSRALYTSLALHGQIDQAVADARSAVRTQVGDPDDWLVPRLYARDLGAATFELFGGWR